MELEEQLRAETAVYLANEDAKALKQHASDNGAGFYNKQRGGTRIYNKQRVKTHFTAFGRDIFRAPHFNNSRFPRLHSAAEVELEEQLRAETAIYLANEDAKALKQHASDNGSSFFKAIAAFNKRPIKVHWSSFGRNFFHTYQCVKFSILAVEAEAKPLQCATAFGLMKEALDGDASAVRSRLAPIQDDGDDSDEVAPGKGSKAPTHMDSPLSVAGVFTDLDMLPLAI